MRLLSAICAVMGLASLPGGIAEEADLTEIARSTVATETQAIQQLKDLAVPITKDAGKVAMETAMERGWWSFAETLLHEANDDGADLGHTIHTTASKIRAKLQGLTDAIQRQHTSSGIAPAFEWAQNPQDIFLNVKFSHKLDTPATLGCETKQVAIQEMSVILRADCKDKRKNFLLNLTLLKGIVPDNSTYSTSSVGRAMLTLRKAENATWSRLLESNKKPANMHVWWAMRDRYEAENDAFDRKQRDLLKAKAAAAAANATATAKTEPESADAIAAAGTLTDAAATPDAAGAPEDRRTDVADAGTVTDASVSADGSSEPVV